MVDALTDRELHVLRLLVSDLSGPEIASEMFVSIHTIRTQYQTDSSPSWT
jgi:LuxR family maltose regulon positive regulatory protein